MELIDGFVYIGRAPRINLYYMQIIFTHTCSWCCYTRSAVVSMATVFDGNPQWSVHSINMNRACTRKKIMDAEASSYDESMSEPVENSNTETADEETTQTSSFSANISSVCAFVYESGTSSRVMYGFVLSLSLYRLGTYA